MLILNVIIVCIPFCFCRDLHNSSVQGFLHRLKRTSEKGRLVEPKRSRKDNLKFNLQLVPTSTGTQAKQPNLPRLVPVITKTILNNNKIERKEPVSRSTKPQLFKLTPHNFTPLKTKCKEPTAPTIEINKVLKSNKADTLPSAVQPKLFTEEPEDNDKPTDRPQSTTQSQNVDTQIEKPIDKESNKKLPTEMLADNEVSEKLEKTRSRASKRRKLKDSKPKCKSDDQETISKVNKTNDSKPVPNSVNKQESPLSRNESTAVKAPIVTKSEDNSAKHKALKENENDVQDNKKKKKKGQKNTEAAIKSNELIMNKSLKDKTPNFLTKKLKIVPSIMPCTVLKKVLLPPKQNDSIQLLKHTNKKPKTEIFTDDNTNNILEHINNDTVDVIEIKQSHIEIMEKHSPINNSVADVYPKLILSNMQPFETQPEHFHDIYQPDTTYTPPPYEYPYPNLNLDSSYSKTHGTLENDPSLTPEAETDKTTYRSWSNTEVLIEKSRNKPVEIQMRARPTFQRPNFNNYYNNRYGYGRNAYYPTYSSYPYYYSKGGYALRNCY